MSEVNIIFKISQAHKADHQAPLADCIPPADKNAFDGCHPNIFGDKFLMTDTVHCALQIHKKFNVHPLTSKASHITLYMNGCLSKCSTSFFLSFFVSFFPSFLPSPLLYAKKPHT